MFLRMDEIVARNILSWLELLKNRYCCIYLDVYIILLYNMYRVIPGGNVALITYPYPASILKKEYNCTSVTPICLHGML